jgi:hypothetical protein
MKMIEADVIRKTGTDKGLQNRKEPICVFIYGSKSSAKPWQLFQ